jgi:hypothetical protein
VLGEVCKSLGDQSQTLERTLRAALAQLTWSKLSEAVAVKSQGT